MQNSGTRRPVLLLEHIISKLAGLIILGVQQLVLRCETSVFQGCKLIMFDSRWPSQPVQHIRLVTDDVMVLEARWLSLF